jgi:hypothetical protein
MISSVLDNLNTHTPAALYETFAPVEANWILWKLDCHYTPTHIGLSLLVSMLIARARLRHVVV